jgi:transcriptional antiterminator NusG
VPTVSGANEDTRGRKRWRCEDQVTVELYEATVPIPVTVRGDQIRVLDSEER